MEEYKCPICEKELNVEKIREGRTIVESTHYCPDKHFGYEFHYGITKYFVGDKSFWWHHADDIKHVKKIKNKIELTIEKFKLRN